MQHFQSPRAGRLAWVRVACVRSSLAAVVIATLLFVAPSLIHASPCSIICGTATTTCDVGITYIITPNDTIDCSGVDVTVKQNGKLEVRDGGFSLIARSLQVNLSGVIRAIDSGPTTGALWLDIETELDANFGGSLRVEGDIYAGDISVKAGGNVTVLNTGIGVRANGDNGGDAGSIEIVTGGSFLTYKPLQAFAPGSGEPYGGEVIIEADNDITVRDLIDVRGYKADGGEVTLTAGGTVELLDNGNIDASSRKEESTGGVVEVSASMFRMNGQEINLRGGVGVSGTNSYGGSLSVQADDVVLNTDSVIDIRGGEGSGGGVGGGAVQIEAGNSLLLGPGVQIIAVATKSGGVGGDVNLSAATMTVEAGALIDTSGGSTTGQAGDVELRACDLDIKSGANIVAQAAEGGSINLYGAGRALAPPAVAVPGVPISASDPGYTVRLAVSSQASVLATTTAGSAGSNGEIRLWVADIVPGECTNDPNMECGIDPDCTVGCETGECLTSNPDLDAVLTQFDVVPSGAELRGHVDCPF